MSGRVKISKLAKMGEASLTAKDIFPVVDAESQLTKKIFYENLSSRILGSFEIVTITDKMRFLGVVGKDPTEYGVDRINGKEYTGEFKVGDVVLFDSAQYIIGEITDVINDNGDVIGHNCTWDKFDIKAFKNTYVSGIKNVNGILVVTQSPVYFDDASLKYRDKVTPVRYQLSGAAGTSHTDSEGNVYYDDCDAMGKPLEDTTLAPDLSNTVIELVQEDADSPGYEIDGVPTKSKFISEDIWTYTGFKVRPSFVVKFGDQELVGLEKGLPLPETKVDYYFEYINNTGDEASAPNTVSTTTAKIKISSVSADNFTGSNIVEFYIRDVEGDSESNP